MEEHAGRAAELLDLGTGGGEWLSSLSRRPARTAATESWPPNVGVARARLEPLGIEVVEVEPIPDNVDQRARDRRRRLPCRDAAFDLVTNRHDSFLASEVARLLRPGGVFLTEQVGGDYGPFYDALGLGRPPRGRAWSLALAAEQLDAAGLRIVEGDEGAEEATFADAGAFAWYLRAIPWAVEGFSIETHWEQLERLSRRIESQGPLVVSQPAFWLAAERAEQPSTPPRQ